jgi:rSAM/selenodomain-associated transferase 1
LKSSDAIIVFTKSPATEKVKTRLREKLPAAEAAEVYEACLKDTLRLVGALPRASRWLLLAPPASPVPALSPRVEGAGATGWYGASAQVGPPSFPVALDDGWQSGRQRGADLGARLETAFAELFRLGARKVVVIGSDTPWMGPQRLRIALGGLDGADFVLGPALDGGYYLIGARRLAPEAFRAIPWGTREVLRSTLRALERARRSYRLLPMDFDLDRPEDLRRAAEILRAEPARAEHLARWLARRGKPPASATQ